MDDLLKKFKEGNVRSLAKVLTKIESREDGFAEIMSEISQIPANSYCLGITGPPGAGKSTLVDGLITLLRKNGKRVGVIAIDPSSPFTGGAVLGDRIRMQDHAADEGVFIRSLGSRGSHGGLSRATRDIVKVVAAFGFDCVIVETVGVGQTELDIMELADTTAVVLVPEAGDTVQTMKAGLLEIADIFVLNKADRPGSDMMLGGLHGLVEMGNNKKWQIPVIETVAFRNEGVELFYQTIRKHREFSEKNENPKKVDIRQREFKEIILELIDSDISKRLTTENHLRKIASDVSDGKINPYSAAQKVIKQIF